jgi:hypothetical protein
VKIYLDNCCFNRPYDDQSSLTIRLETEAKLEIQDKIRSGLYLLGWSYILDIENAANPFAERRTEIVKWRTFAFSSIKETPEVLSNMNEFVSKGIKPLDALHLACATALKCGSFITVDKGIQKKAGQVLKIEVTIDFVMKQELES